MIPDSVMGRLSRRAQKVAKELLKRLDGKPHLPVTDKELRDSTGLNLRTIQRALHELDNDLHFFGRLRVNGRRVITVLKNLLDRKPKDEPAAKPSSAKKTKTEQRSVDATRAASAQLTIDAMEAHGLAPQLVGGDLKWEPIAGTTRRELNPGLKTRIEYYEADIRALVGRSRPAKE